jgi:hypothetical protein
MATLKPSELGARVVPLKFTPNVTLMAFGFFFEPLVAGDVDAETS